MTEKEIIEKMHRRLDKELSPSEEEAFDRYLDQHETDKRLFGELQAMHSRLMDEKVRSPQTIDVKKEVLNRINMEKYIPKSKDQEIRVVRSFWSRPVVKFGFAFVMGVFAGLLLFTFFKVDFSGRDVIDKEVKGTFYDSRSFGNMKTAGILQFDSPLAKAVCNVRYSTKVVEIRLDLSSLYPVRATLEFDYNNFEVLNAQNVSVNDQTTAIAASNYIQINNTGDNKFIFQLYNKNSLPHDISFKILQNDAPIYQNSVQVNKE